MPARKNTTFFAKVLNYLNGMGNQICDLITRIAESSGQILTEGCRFLTIATCIYIAINWEASSQANTLALFACAGWAMGNLAGVAAGKREIVCALRWPMGVALVVAVATHLQN